MQGAIVTMTKCLAKQLIGSRGIRVNAGVPRLVSSVKTPKASRNIPAPSSLALAACWLGICDTSQSNIGAALQHPRANPCMLPAVAPGPVWTPLIAESFPAEKVRLLRA